MREVRVVLVLGLCFVLTGVSHAVIYPFEIFTSNGPYYNDPSVDLSMDVTNDGGVADFTFYNNSTVDCCITRIFFDNGVLLGATLSIVNGSETDFSEIYPGPGDLPGGNLINFSADKEFNSGAEAPPPENGVNNVIDSIAAGEWVMLSFELINGGTLSKVLAELDSAILRVGLHVQGFPGEPSPDDYSESAVNIPEPATICLLGLGALALLRKRRA